MKSSRHALTPQSTPPSTLFHGWSDMAVCLPTFMERHFDPKSPSQLQYLQKRCRHNCKIPILEIKTNLTPEIRGDRDVAARATGQDRNVAIAEYRRYRYGTIPDGRGATSAISPLLLPITTLGTTFVSLSFPLGATFASRGTYDHPPSFPQMPQPLPKFGFPRLLLFCIGSYSCNKSRFYKPNLCPRHDAIAHHTSG